jgi:DNA polymerase-1
MSQWLILDGYNLAFRSFYAVPELTRRDGFPTNAIHGWIRTLWKLADLYPDARQVVTFDMGSALRLELQPAYKANRSETPESLEQQIPELKRITAYLGLPILALEGVEADDIIGTLAARLSEDGEGVIIVSADKDLGQCLRPGVRQLLPPPTANPKLGWREMDAAGLEEKLGIRPDQVPDYLALMGDTSDNIIGVKGVGPKTASRWIQDYGSLTNLLERIPEVKPERFQPLLAEAADRLRENIQMTTLQTIELPEEWATGQPDPEAVLAFFKEMEMENSARQFQERRQLF